MTDADQEALWARERAEALDRLIEAKARVIVAMPSVLERRMALEQWDYRRPARIRERLEARVNALWEAGRGGRAA
jgi:hypothetical protein